MPAWLKALDKMIFCVCPWFLAPIFIVTDGVIVPVSPLVNHLMFVILSPSAFLTSSTKQYYTGLTKEH